MSSTNMINVVYLDFLTKYVKVHKQIKRLNVECERLLYEYTGLGGSKITKKEFSSNHQILIEMIEMIENQQTNYGLLYNDVMLKEYKKAKEHVLYLENLINHIVVENKRLSASKTMASFPSAFPPRGPFTSSGTSSGIPSGTSSGTSNLPPEQVDGSLKKQTKIFKQLIEENVVISIENVKKTIGCDKTNCAFYICSDPTTGLLWKRPYCASNKSRNEGTKENLENDGYYNGDESSGNYLIMDNGIAANKFVYETIEYVPPKNYAGRDSIDVKIYDKTAKKLTIELTIQFNNINTTGKPSTKKVIVDKKQTAENLLEQQQAHEKFLKDQEEAQRKANEEALRKANEEALRKANEEAQKKANETLDKPLLISEKLKNEILNEIAIQAPDSMVTGKDKLVGNKSDAFKLKYIAASEDMAVLSMYYLMDNVQRKNLIDLVSKSDNADAKGKMEFVVDKISNTI